MAEVQPIIIKRKKGGHAAAHGGAWKVAYADFVTAMMCFFLVMWLLGSDEATRAAVAEYFNNPTSAWRKDLTSSETMPLGDKTGAGENILNGNDGKTPDDLVQRPVKPYSNPETEGSKVAQLLEALLSDDSTMTLDEIKFSIPEDLLYAQGKTDVWNGGAEKILKNIGTLARKYKGRLSIQGAFDPAMNDGSTYEFKMARTVNVSHYLIEKNWAAEERIKTSVLEHRPADRDPSSGPSPHRLEFTLRRVLE